VKAKQPSGQKHPRRRTSPARTKELRLRPGQKLVTPGVIVTARQGQGLTGVKVKITCKCTKADPNKPDCEPSVTTSPGGTVNVKCEKSGGCKVCDTTVTTTGVFAA
jgi:hypothetical protein